VARVDKHNGSPQDASVFQVNDIAVPFLSEKSQAEQQRYKQNCYSHGLVG
jgi:hypothetical protein